VKFFGPFSRWPKLERKMSKPYVDIPTSPRANPNDPKLYALRFFIGLLESCSFPGYSALLGSWYSQGQLGKRVAFFEQASAISSVFSGYLQAALYKGLNGRGGLAGWRWLFIFDAIISIPVAVWSFWAISDLPHNTSAFHFSKEVTSQPSIVP
jgi:ACS family pantothenate transporter-like MFS transporter